MEKLITALTELEKLKYVERGTNVKGRKESTAEHSWSCMMIADILIDFVEEPLDRLKVMEYLLYHDIVEVYAGDAKFNNPDEMKLKYQKEASALAKIKTFIPNQNRFDKITSEYEERKTREAEFAKAVDCLDACIRNINDETKSANDGFTAELIRQKYLPHVSQFDITKELFEHLMLQLRKLNKL
ncbi:HD domain-containing protein [Sphingobacterium tabacisoli]|uniref:HD family hydrolase n=1 Tax=Sphingobacterium tabacisoli TaxID=2044855 RepID=A0ABW5L2U2_9SPHI|nr:HD domain-containing protein [Sphingobacterium tabacisoli]